MVTLSTLASGAIKSAAEVSAAVVSISCNVNLFVNKMARMINVCNKLRVAMRIGQSGTVSGAVQVDQSRCSSH